MEETQKIFEPTPIQGEETLVTAADGSLQTPRFDEVEAQVARPVVPLSSSAVRQGGVGRRRQWPIALVLISALAGGVVSLLAFRLYQQRQQTESKVATTTQSDGTEKTADANAAGNPEPTPLAQTGATETGAQAQSDAPVVFEEFDPAKEGVATAGGTSRNGGEAKPAGKATEADAKPSTSAKEERKDESKPAPRANAEARPRLVEVITSPRPVEPRGENVSRDERRRDDDNDAFEDRRERRRERREQRREGRRGRGRNIDRIKDIFEGPPPA
ncbi:MAG TPA: hypothetical protein VGO96_17330 [Pyrinomonadaceae bacterium]|jgi:hypothetical protein|nr:hypothetical protein [Pyrinomonadaceae bacterium]